MSDKRDMTASSFDNTIRKGTDFWIVGVQVNRRGIVRNLPNIMEKSLYLTVGHSNARLWDGRSCNA